MLKSFTKSIASIQFNNRAIEEGDIVNHLGIILDKKLTSAKHINIITSRILKLTLIFHIFLLDYSISVWSTEYTLNN